MEHEQKFNLELVFGNTNMKATTTIKLENVKSGEVFQRIESSFPDFPYHPEDLINQYVKEMKQQELNETKKFLVTDGKFKVNDWYRLISTRIK